MEKTPQEREFQAWGLSKLAVRNIVVFFIICLISAMAIMARVIQAKDDEVRQVYRELIREKDAGAIKIEQLKNENLETLIKINDIIVKQDGIMRKIHAAKSRLKKISK